MAGRRLGQSSSQHLARMGSGGRARARVRGRTPQAAPGSSTAAPAAHPRSRRAAAPAQRTAAAACPCARGTSRTWLARCSPARRHTGVGRPGDAWKATLAQQPTKAGGALGRSQQHAFFFLLVWLFMPPGCSECRTGSAGQRAAHVTLTLTPSYQGGGAQVVPADAGVHHDQARHQHDCRALGHVVPQLRPAARARSTQHARAAGALSHVYVKLWARVAFPTHS